MRNAVRRAQAWTLVIVVLCLLPARWIPEGSSESAFLPIPHKDKIVHFGMFALFGFLWMRAGSSANRAPSILFFGLALAVATELGQALPIIERDPDLLDALADALGLAVGIGTASLFCLPQPLEGSSHSTR